VLEVPMRNDPTPTTGHWDILDIYAPGPAPGERAAHVATD
jgi:acetolactate synthase-1/2/3 large subunit